MTSPIESYAKDFRAGDELKASELNGLVAAINETRNRVNSTITDLGTLDGKITAQNIKISAAEDKVTELSGKVANLTTNVTANAEKIQTLKNDVSVIKSDVSAIKLDNDTIHTSITSIQNNLSEISNEFNSFRTTVLEKYVAYTESPGVILSDNVSVARIIISSVEHLGILETSSLTEGGFSVIEQKFFSLYNNTIKVKRTYNVSSGEWGPWETRYTEE